MPEEIDGQGLSAGGSRPRVDSRRATCHAVVPLLDNLGLEALAAACAEARRYAVLMVVAPPNVAGGTGSPVDPVAVL